MSRRGMVFLPILWTIGALLLGGGVGVLATKESHLFTNPRPAEIEIAETQTDNSSKETTITEESISTTTDSEVKKTQTTSALSPVVSNVSKQVIQPIKSNLTSTNTKDSAETLFKISDVDVDADENEATIGWKTSKPSDSRLVLHVMDKGEIFVSPKYNSQMHGIKISDVKSSTSYTYEIIAETDSGEEDTLFGSFATEREFVTRYLPELTDENCTVVVIEDTAGKPLVGAEVKLQGVNSGGSSRLVLSAEIDRTNEDGEAEYCKKFDELKITDTTNGEVYQKE